MPETMRIRARTEASRNGRPTVPAGVHNVMRAKGVSGAESGVDRSSGYVVAGSYAAFSLNTMDDVEGREAGPAPDWPRCCDLVIDRRHMPTAERSPRRLAPGFDPANTALRAAWRYGPRPARELFPSTTRNGLAYGVVQRAAAYRSTERQRRLHGPHGDRSFGGSSAVLSGQRTACEHARVLARFGIDHTPTPGSRGRWSAPLRPYDARRGRRGAPLVQGNAAGTTSGGVASARTRSCARPTTPQTSGPWGRRLPTSVGYAQDV